MADRRSSWGGADRVGCRKKNLEARARWEFGAAGTVASVKARIDRAKTKKGGESAPEGPRWAPPELLPENLLPWAIFRSCLTQLIVGPMGGVVGVSHHSLDFKFRVFGVGQEREAEVFEKFELLESIFVAEMNATATAKREQGEPLKKRRNQLEQE